MCRPGRVDKWTRGEAHRKAPRPVGAARLSGQGPESPGSPGSAVSRRRAAWRARPLRAATCNPSANGRIRQKRSASTPTTAGEPSASSWCRAALRFDPEGEHRPADWVELLLGVKTDEGASGLAVGPPHTARRPDLPPRQSGACPECCVLPREQSHARYESGGTSDGLLRDTQPVRNRRVARPKLAHGVRAGLGRLAGPNWRPGWAPGRAVGDGRTRSAKRAPPISRETPKAGPAVSAVASGRGDAIARPPGVDTPSRRAVVRGRTCACVW